MPGPCSRVRARLTPPSEEQAPPQGSAHTPRASAGRTRGPRRPDSADSRLPRSATGPTAPQATPGRGAAASCRPQPPRGSNPTRPPGATSRSGSRAATHGARSQDRGPEAAGRRSEEKRNTEDEATTATPRGVGFYRSGKRAPRTPGS